MNRIAITGLLVAGLFAAPVVFAKSVSFDVVNGTGANLTAIYTGPTGEDEWGPNILDGTIKNGGTVSITLDGLSGCDYDFRYEFSDRETYEEYGIDVCAIDGAEFKIK